MSLNALSTVLSCLFLLVISKPNTVHCPKTRGQQSSSKSSSDFIVSDFVFPTRWIRLMEISPCVLQSMCRCELYALCGVFNNPSFMPQIPDGTWSWPGHCSACKHAEWTNRPSTAINPTLRYAEDIYSTHRKDLESDHKDKSRFSTEGWGQRENMKLLQQQSSCCSVQIYCVMNCCLHVWNTSIRGISLPENTEQTELDLNSEQRREAWRPWLVVQRLTEKLWGLI